MSKWQSPTSSLHKNNISVFCHRKRTEILQILNTETVTQVNGLCRLCPPYLKKWHSFIKNCSLHLKSHCEIWLERVSSIKSILCGFPVRLQLSTLLVIRTWVMARLADDEPCESSWWATKCLPALSYSLCHYTSSCLLPTSRNQTRNVKKKRGSRKPTSQIIYDRYNRF